MSHGGLNNRNGGSRTVSPKNSYKLTDRQLSSSSMLSVSSPKSAPKPPRRSNTATNNFGVGGRVRVAVRLRPQNAEESVADFSQCVELQPELKRLLLRKDNWEADTYDFDEVLSEHASQARVYEVVAKPVVESVLKGYNGTVMAYGQTGTGKTYTVGGLGDEDPSARGIMVRAMEHILAEMSPDADQVLVSYLQLYKETVQDLLRPQNGNMSIVEDPKTGDISLPGAAAEDIKDLKMFIELLRLGETHRFTTNTNMNAESSRSHTILMVHVKRYIKGKDSSVSNENDKMSKPVVHKGKLMVVDLAGSERNNKTGTKGLTLEEGNSINLSLSALGKCIDALADNSSHVPVRESKLTRLLRDSFGGSARTSLIVTIGPSRLHLGETASTLKFGKRAMNVENVVKMKIDYRSLTRELQNQLDTITAENERKQKALQDEIERRELEAENRIGEIERNHTDQLEEERLKYMDLIEKLQEQLQVQGKGKVGLLLKDESKLHEDQYRKLLAELDETKLLLQNETLQRNAAEEEISSLRYQLSLWEKFEAAGNFDMLKPQKMLEDESHEKAKLQKDMTRRLLGNEDSKKLSGDFGSFISRSHSQTSRGSVDAKLREQGLQKILFFLESEDAGDRIRALRYVANLALEEPNREMIVKAGGLTSLLRLLSCDDETFLTVAAGAIANLASNAEIRTMIIASEEGIHQLSVAADKAKDPRTLYRIAGAIANLCGNDKFLEKLRGEGGIKALLGMVKCRHPAVLERVARGIANFAIRESEAFQQGMKTGRSFIIEDGALPWILESANSKETPIRRFSELTLCYLAQHEANAKDMISKGAVLQLVRILQDCPRDDIKRLAHKVLTCNPSFEAEVSQQVNNNGSIN